MSYGGGGDILTGEGYALFYGFFSWAALTYTQPSAWGRASEHLIYNNGQCAQFPHRKNASQGPSGALVQPYLCWPTIWSTFRCSHSIRQHIMCLTSSPGLCSLVGQQGPLPPAPGSALAFLRIMPSHDHEIVS